MAPPDGRPSGGARPRTLSEANRSGQPSNQQPQNTSIFQGQQNPPPQQDQRPRPNQGSYPQSGQFQPGQYQQPGQFQQQGQHPQQGPYFQPGQHPQTGQYQQPGPSQQPWQYPQGIPPQYPQHDQATGGPPDEVDARIHHRNHVNFNIGYHRTVSTVEEVSNETHDVFKTFLAQRLESDGYDIPGDIKTQNRVKSDVAITLQRIGDDLTNNTGINDLIGQIKVTPDTVYKTFFSVAMQLFSDGNVNWGRIVALFYFAYRLALQCLTNMSLLQTIIGWVGQFVYDKLASWISARGGWGAIKEWFGSTSAQMVGVFLAGMIFSFGILWFKK